MRKNLYSPCLIEFNIAYATYDMNDIAQRRLQILLRVEIRCEEFEARLITLQVMECIIHYIFRSICEGVFKATLTPSFMYLYVKN